MVSEIDMAETQEAGTMLSLTVMVSLGKNVQKGGSKNEQIHMRKMMLLRQ